MTQETTTAATMTIGIDLGDRMSHYCVLDMEGAVQEEGRSRTDREAFQQRFGNAPPARVAIEAGTHSPGCPPLLEEAGHEVLVANPRKLRLI